MGGGGVEACVEVVTDNEVRTGTGKSTSSGGPSRAEDQGDITPVTGITGTPPTGNVAKGQKITLAVAVQPEGATDKTFRATSANQNFATITVKGNTITVKGVAAGKAQIPVVTGNGEFAAVAEITVTDGAAG
ncbi:phage major tail protein [Escherichia coli]|nr:phage major tail protein [Escherichia coli]